MFTIYSGIIQIINQIIRKRDAIHRQAVAILCRNLYRIKYQTIIHSTLNMVASSLSILPHPVAYMRRKSSAPVYPAVHRIDSVISKTDPKNYRISLLDSPSKLL